MSPQGGVPEGVSFEWLPTDELNRRTAKAQWFKAGGAFKEWIRVWQEFSIWVPSSVGHHRTSVFTLRAIGLWWKLEAYGDRGWWKLWRFAFEKLTLVMEQIREGTDRGQRDNENIIAVCSHFIAPQNYDVNYSTFPNEEPTFHRH